MHRLEMPVDARIDSIITLSGELSRDAQGLSDDDHYTMPQLEIESRVEKIDEALKLLEGAKTAIKNCKK
jgi:hypothetical protein